MTFEIADRQFESRLIIGTGGFRNLQVMAEAVAELLTGGEPPAELQPFGPERFGAGVT